MTDEKITISDWNPADYIETKEDVLAYLEVALEEDSPEFLMRTIGHIARSKGMSRIAEELNLDMADLSGSLSQNNNTSFKTLYNVLALLGFRLKIEKKSASASASTQENSTTGERKAPKKNTGSFVPLKAPC
jgi:probable addiction module antidote protein